MSIAKTAKLLNNLLDSQKTDRARIKQLERLLTESDTCQAAAVATAVSTAEMQFRGQLERVQQERAVEHASLTALVTHKDRQITELATTKDWQITVLRQELDGVRQLLAAADTANVELQGTVETLGENLDRVTQAAATLTDERAEIARQREALNHLLDEVREHMRKKDYDRESAILNRRVLAHAAPGVNRK